MDVILRATAIFFLLWLMMKGLGKRELAEVSPFELVVLVIIGDLVQQGVTGDDRSVTGAALAVTTIAFWVLVASYASYRFKRARDVLDGVPVVVVRDGKPVHEHLAIERLSLEDLKGEARSQGIDDLGRVRVAILEPGGHFSFVLHEGPISQQQRNSRGPVH